MTQLPEINSLIAVHVEGSDILYRSRIEGIDGAKLIVALPSDGMTEHRLAHGTRLSVEWFVGRGIGSVDGFVAGHTDVGVTGLIVELLGEPEIFQRRNHARGDVCVNIDIWPDPEDEEPVTGVTLDLSGGGMRAVIAADVEREQLVRFSLDMGDVKPINGIARVVDTRDGDIVALELHEIVPGDRERLIKAVFASYRGESPLKRNGM